jgi:hypothetical protein
MADHLRDATKKIDFISREEFLKTILEETSSESVGELADFVATRNLYLDWCGGMLQACQTAQEIPAADVVEVVRCKNCKHRPVVVNPSRPYGSGLAGPGSDPFGRDETCPYLCDDGYYNRMPRDDGFCNLGEVKDG